MYLVTRPKPKLAQSLAAFNQAGIFVTGVAPFDIVYRNSALSALGTHLETLQPNTVIIVTSKFAADALSHVTNGKVIATTVIAVGIATQQALSTCCKSVVVPEKNDSEGILATAELRRDNLQSVIIIKGIGGRDLIESTLQGRNITVNIFDVYERVKLNPVYSSAKWQWPEVKGIIATSGEMALSLIETYGLSSLQTLPWLTVSKRVATLLNQQGIRSVQVCTGASDPALIHWVKENWE